MPFLEITNRRELAEELGTTDKKLAYIIYKIPDDKRYRTFDIPKRNGGTRKITAPVIQLKAIQRQLANKLIEIYPGRREVHGFAKGKNTYSNAQLHVHRRWIVNIDLEDFFPSIHFGRVRGMFQAKPFSFSETLSRELANLCCCDHRLPQGAPTSPVISNLICWKMDNQLHALAKEAKCTYTRYADDICFSTNLRELSPLIGTIDDDNKLHLSERLTSIIESNRFKINAEKIRYACRNNRQEVTGLIVNGKSPNVRRTYVRKVRAMLHACEKYGVDAAAKEHFEKYALDKHPTNESLAFMEELVGRACYIRYIKRIIKDDGTWEDSPVFKPLRSRIKAVFPEAQMAPTRQFIAESDRPVILGEGKTDWKILKRALQVLQEGGEFTDLQIKFREYGEDEAVGWSNLLDLCEKSWLMPPEKTVICVFDGDLKECDYRKAISATKPYRDWGHHVFSLVLPKPSARPRREVSIEQYFSDDEIRTKDAAGRRLYISTEFNPETGVHQTDPNISFKGILGCLKKPYPFIIDSCVKDKEGHSLAMSKSDFADNILNANGVFKNFDFSNFRMVFESLQEILATEE